MKCPRCGVENAEDAKFCMNCSAELVQEVEAVPLEATEVPSGRNASPEGEDLLQGLSEVQDYLQRMADKIVDIQTLKGSYKSFRETPLKLEQGMYSFQPLISEDEAAARVQKETERAAERAAANARADAPKPIQSILLLSGLVMSISFGIMMAFEGNKTSIDEMSLTPFYLFGMTLISLGIFALGVKIKMTFCFGLGGFQIVCLAIAWLMQMTAIFASGNRLDFWLNFLVVVIPIGIFVGKKIYKKRNLQAEVQAEVQAKVRKKIDEVNQQRKNANQWAATENRKLEAENLQIPKINEQIKRKDREYNEQVRQNNDQIDLQLNNAVKELKALGNELLTKTQKWYPRSDDNRFYSLCVVNDFINIVKSHRADTVKEMINAYDNDQKHKESIQAQRNTQRVIYQSMNNLISQVDQCTNKIISQMNQNTSEIRSQMNQSTREISNLLQQANMIQTARLVEDSIIARDASRTADAANRNAYNSGRAADTLERMRRGY